MTQMTSYEQIVTNRYGLSLKRALLVGFLGGALAAVGNLIVYAVAEWLLQMNLVVPTGPDGSLIPLSPGNVAITSFIPGMSAGLLLWLIGRWTAQPFQVFLGIAVSFLLFSFTAPLGLATIPDPVRVVLSIMHIVAALLITWVIARYARP